MKDIKLKPAVPNGAQGLPPKGLMRVDESIDEIAEKALEAAKRAEELETAKRDAAKTAKSDTIKAAT